MGCATVCSVQLTLDEERAEEWEGFLEESRPRMPKAEDAGAQHV